jgi:hypothetical protein
MKMTVSAIDAACVAAPWSARSWLARSIRPICAIAELRSILLADLLEEILALDRPRVFLLEQEASFRHTGLFANLPALGRGACEALEGHQDEERKAS